MLKTLDRVTVPWYDPRTPPAGISLVLIVFDDQVWAGSYANGLVVRYPEDYPPVRLSACAAWAYPPAQPATRKQATPPTPASLHGRTRRQIIDIMLQAQHDGDDALIAACRAAMKQRGKR